tara:strand:- start:1885 stop:2490 length:606 start_codon:yes stop_codon:yes gene_type:complete
MKLKVCGLSRKKEIITCINHEVEFCGLILNYPKSHRHITFSRARELIKIKRKKTKFVGVLVNPTDKDLKKFSHLKLDYFQLYGKYDNSKLRLIKKKFKKKIISVIVVKKKKDVHNYKKIKDNSDIILWDSSGYEKSLTWNYDWIKHIRTKAKKMVAGNITINKLKYLKNYADIVDVSGALETRKKKDIKKIKEFVKQVRKL